MQIEVGGTVVKYNSHTQREFMVFTELTEIGVKKEVLPLCTQKIFKYS
jgi:hypothetical protein